MKKVALALILLASLAAAYLYFAQAAPPRVSYVQPSRELLVSYVATNGRVDPVEDYEVFSAAAGQVLKVVVTEGDRVAKGSLLATIENGAALASLEQAKARLETARAELASIERGGSPKEIADLKHQLGSAERAREKARQEVGALRRLAGKQAATGEDLTGAESDLASREAEVAALHKKLNLGAPPERKDAASARVREAESVVALAGEQVSSSVIRSPADGVLYSLDLREGSFLTPGTRVAKVGNVDRVRIVVFVDEPELGRIRLGSAVKITADAYPNRIWEGQVDRLPTEVVSLETRRVGEVWCSVENSGGELIPNLTVSIQLESGVAENALTLPREAVAHDAGQPFVWVLGEDQTAEKRPVELGIQNAARSQITNGLDGSEQVLLEDSAALTAGSRVIPVEQVRP
jgi:HlyD family secretion protein